MAFEGAAWTGNAAQARGKAQPKLKSSPKTCDREEGGVVQLVQAGIA